MDSLVIYFHQCILLMRCYGSHGKSWKLCPCSQAPLCLLQGYSNQGTSSVLKIEKARMWWIFKEPICVVFHSQLLVFPTLVITKSPWCARWHGLDTVIFQWPHRWLENDQKAVGWFWKGFNRVNINHDLNIKITQVDKVVVAVFFYGGVGECGHNQFPLFHVHVSIVLPGKHMWLW